MEIYHLILINPEKDLTEKQFIQIKSIQYNNKQRKDVICLFFKELMRINYTPQNSKKVQCMNQKYTKLEKIAEGSYGVVYKARDNSTNQFVTLKKFKKQNSTEGIPQNCLREIQMLRMLQGSKEVIQIKDVVLSSQGTVTIVYNYHETSLKSFLEDSGTPFNPRTYMKQILQGLQVIHDYNIIHRDIKPGNILITKNGELRFADFGLARQGQSTMTNGVGTSYYRAPELVLGETHYTKAVDVWGAGCIFYELIKRTVLFTGKNDSEIIIKIWTLLGNKIHGLNGLPFPHNKVQLPTPDEALRKKTFEGIPEDALDLLLKLLDLNPKNRIKASDALKHKYFNEKLQWQDK